MYVWHISYSVQGILGQCMYGTSVTQFREYWGNVCMTKYYKYDSAGIYKLYRALVIRHTGSRQSLFNNDNLLPNRKQLS